MRFLPAHDSVQQLPAGASVLLQHRLLAITIGVDHHPCLPLRNVLTALSAVVVVVHFFLPATVSAWPHVAGHTGGLRAALQGDEMWDF